MLGSLFRRKPRLVLDRGYEPEAGWSLRDWFRETFWRQDDPRNRRTAAAWTISFLVHASLGATLAFLVFSTPKEEDDSAFVVSSGLYDEGQEQLDVARPEAELAEHMVEITSSPTPKADASEISQLPSPSLSPTKIELNVIGVGAGASEANSAMLGLSGDSAGPKVEFIGLQGRAGKIVYVIDRSGSMLNSFPYLLSELNQSIDRLSPQQYFHVIFFDGFTDEQLISARRRLGPKFDGESDFYRAGRFIETLPRKLVPAIQVYKEKTKHYLDLVEAEGQTDPVPAMKRAFELEPDLIYFLTDGEFNPVLLEHLARWNRDHKVRIFTLAFVFQGNTRLLKQIAQDHGGKYRFVDEYDLGR